MGNHAYSFVFPFLWFVSLIHDFHALTITGKDNIDSHADSILIVITILFYFLQ